MIHHEVIRNCSQFRHDAVCADHSFRRRFFRLNIMAPLLLFLLPLTGGYSQELLPASDTSDLINRSLDLDISTARREELAAWCMVLGLSDDGSEDALRGRLRTHYGLGSASSFFAPAGSGTRVVIESAQRSEYFKVDLDTVETESVVRLSGEVVISVTEAGRNRTHRVEADSVVFNQKKNTISAMGNIVYTVDTGGREEHFSGDSLTFEVTDWTGVIFRGTSERQQDVDGQKVDFFFRGESIERAGQDILILNNGVITSHDDENPDYALKAKKIWITGPGEWGLYSATLYVGHVPVFYLPFYWKSGSDLLFNPVLGFRSRVGYYLQSTTYLLGRKEEDDGFSIMGFGDSAGGNTELTRDGLFLVKGPATPGSEQENGNTLKYLLDIYTSLGAMTGFAGTFPSLGESGSLDFYATIGVSRSIDSNGSIYFDDAGTASQFWNSSYLGSAEIPFRWGSRLDFTWDRWSLYADWYSDPSYLRDFDNRKENFDWLTFLLGQEGTDINEPDLVTDMKWEIRGSETINTPGAGPWLENISLDNFRTSLTWKNKPNDDVVSSGQPDAAYDPARNFYYPDRLILPDLKLSLRGGSPQWSVNRLNAPDTGELEAVESEPGSDGIDGPDAVPFQQGLDAVYSTGLLNASLKYGLQSQLYIDDKSDSTGWLAPSDIDFLFDAARVNTTQQGNLSYSVDFWDGLTGITGSTSLSGFYQTHSDLFGNDTVISDTTRLEDYKYSKLLWDNRLKVFLNPFQGIPELAESSVSYSVDANLFSRKFSNTATVADPDYSNTWLSGKDDFRQNEASAVARWKPGVFDFSLVTTADVPPLDQRYTIRTGAGASFSGFKVNLSQQNNFTGGAWGVQPLIMGASWVGWQDEVTLSQTARFDAENARFTNTETLFRFWGFETRFAANYGKSYNWNQLLYQWEEGPEGLHPDSLRFSYNRTFSPRPLWKNRILTRTVLDTFWNINLSQPTDNVLGFRWTQEFKIYKFLDLKFSFSSTNRSMYLYFPWWRDELGISDSYNFFEDLLRSFNVFNPQDRLDSQFNMDRFDLALVHHLRSWDLTIEYSGWPALESGASVYSWKSEFSLYVKWNPLPIFNQRTQFKDDSWTVDSFE